MTAWHRGYLLALDTETTGTDPDLARIVTTAAILLARMIRNKTVQENAA